jgi:glutaredoxin
VTLYTASGCSLCESALEVIRAAQEELAFDLRIVDIGDNAELERRYRERLPVVEIDGDETFHHFVDPGALRARLS